MINFIYNDGTGQYSLSKTNSNGLLDANFGNSGIFPIPASINSIPYTLESSSYKTQGSGNVFLLVESNNTNDYEIISYSFSGNLQTINALQTFPTGFNRYDFYPYPAPYTYRIEIKDNYIYLFTPTKIIKYIISNSTLSVSENADKNDLVQFANPFGDQLLLNTNEKIKSIDIYDEGGRLVLRNKSSKNIDTSGLNQGAYFIKVTTESNQIIYRKGIKN
ncbi:T9SS type A sorting domain-containing protein [Chryseobacterium sp. C-71]|uniref:T9SS type A sorting domain-containing protein n=1 Tax=Chryseobacterium sp. C-71 TaxID=2893882 RepID=UPI001E53AD62|nr:T9SS type A sorting domain-containing protein [Chryseobacterium sp. C-71]UFH32081.1 T9SS type A sorting domain-containing protein [Chryseobacterium sp. C-71]